MNKEIEVVSEPVGWVKLFRSVMDTDLWQDKPFTRGQAWVDLIMLAGHKDKEFWLNATCLTLKRGQFVASKRKLAERWGWSVKKVSKFLAELEKVNMVSAVSDHQKTTITVINYGKYQGNSEETQRKQQRNSKETARKQIEKQQGNSEETQRKTTKEIKNIKEGEESKEGPAALFPPDDAEEDDEEWLTGDELIARSKAGDGNGAV